MLGLPSHQQSLSGWDKQLIREQIHRGWWKYIVPVAWIRKVQIFCLSFIVEIAGSGRGGSVFFISGKGKGRCTFPLLKVQCIKLLRVLCVGVDRHIGQVSKCYCYSTSLHHKHSQKSHTYLFFSGWQWKFTPQSIALSNLNLWESPYILPNPEKISS